MSEIGRWVVVYDNVKKPFVEDPGSLTWGESGRDPGWRIAWDFERYLAYYGEMTFGRAEESFFSVIGSTLLYSDFHILTFQKNKIKKKQSSHR